MRNSKLIRREIYDFSWDNANELKIRDEITETLKDGREVVFVVMDDGVVGLKNLLGYHCMNEEVTNEGAWLACDMRRWLNSEVLALLPDELLRLLNLASLETKRTSFGFSPKWRFLEIIFGARMKAVSSSSTSRTATTVPRSTSTKRRAGGGNVLLMSAIPVTFVL